MRVTIRDVARAAGVSVTTVSRALNGAADVGEETRQRVIEVAKQLNYRPSHVARSLVLRKSQNIGLLVSDFRKGSHHFLYDVLVGVHDTLAEYGYDVTLVSTDTARQQLVSYVDFCRARGLDGVIVMGIRLDDPYVEEVVESTLPSVVIDLPLLSRHCGYVMTDNVNGARYAVRHLVSRGCRRIGFVNGAAHAAVSRERLRGFEDAARQYVGEFDERLVVYGDFTLEGGQRALAELLAKAPDVDGVFFASDLMAIGGIQHCKAMGIRIPDDLAVVGFDDIDLARFVTPALTTVAQPRYEMGCEAAKMLVHMLQKGKMPSGTLLPPQLVVRETA
ncbi:LacI family DNA-binding transcriptional regulator [Alicyclobacillus acidocaldarius]|uniref:LacI family DNA-binding transcriptional regulator n=1 Tax=Alicyclobacillus acidocaldarius TaxID=405212 RepID=UPI00345E79AC